MRENKLLVQLLLQLMLRFFALFRVFSLYFRYFSSNPEIKVRIYALKERQYSYPTNLPTWLCEQNIAFRVQIARARNSKKNR